MMLFKFLLSKNNKFGNLISWYKFKPQSLSDTIFTFEKTNSYKIELDTPKIHSAFSKWFLSKSFTKTGSKLKNC